ncbi:MAG: DUF362 domain-containing protein [Sedimentisphaerales bacterium]|nr:DUF362 domain-containing protein [Sedimentisphaerales bacterium]
MQNATRTIVALTRCIEYKESTIAGAISRQFSLLGGLEQFVKRGDSVLLKPNFIAPRPRHCATQTDPAVIIETAKLLKDFGARPFVGDSPAWGNVHTCAKAIGLEEPLKKLDVPIRQLNKPVRRQIAGVAVGISSVALNADVIVNLPKFKSHQQLVATFAVKNMFGCVSGKWKAYWHFAKGGNAKKFCELLIEIYKLLSPALTIIDGVIIMDGPGPISGRARPLGWLVGGTDPMACEIVCSKLINLEPDRLPIVNTAKQKGFGCTNPETIEIVGDQFPDTICNDFVLAEPIPIRFSLLHVCKSICKQAVLLAKSIKK